jgi:hypothetical protein
MRENNENLSQQGGRPGRNFKKLHEHVLNASQPRHRQTRSAIAYTNWSYSAWSQASAAVDMKSSGLLCAVRWFNTDVSGLPIGPIFKGQLVARTETKQITWIYFNISIRSCFYLVSALTTHTSSVNVISQLHERKTFYCVVPFLNYFIPPDGGRFKKPKHVAI